MGAGVAEHRCLDDEAPPCAISPSHPAVSTVVQFYFETPHTNTRGASVQTQLACQCINADCTQLATVAIRRRPPSAPGASTANASCTYQAVAEGGRGAGRASEWEGEVEGEMSTLHSRVSAMTRIGTTVVGPPVGPSPLEDFQYNVTRFGVSTTATRCGSGSGGGVTHTARAGGRPRGHPNPQHPPPPMRG